jgi:hypothetical protein
MSDKRDQLEKEQDKELSEVARRIEKNMLPSRRKRYMNTVLSLTD